MHDLYANVLSYLQQIWLYRLPALLTAAVVCLGGWAYVYVMPDMYKASTLIYVDTETTLRPLLKGLAVDDTEMEMELVRVTRRSLLSRPSLRRIARETDLDLRATTKDEMERLLTSLATKIRVKTQSTTGTRRRADNIVSIAYENSEPEVAKRVVEALLNVFIESLMGANRTDTESSEQFLDKQIKEYKTRLEAAEQKLEEFKRANAGMLPGEGRGYFALITDAKERLRSATLDVREARNRRDQLKSQIIEMERSRPAATEETAAGYVALTRAKLDELDERLAELTLRYTDAHPDVISTRRTMEEVRSKLEKQQGQSSAGTFDGRVVEELRIEMGKAEAELAAVQVRVDEYESRLDELNKAVDIVPRVEAEYVKLTRDYDVFKSQYDELVKRRESARLSREAELSADESQFQVIEPPTIPLFPVRPDRPILLTMVLMAGLAAGVGMGFVLSQIRPTFVSIKSLRATVELPVWGRVSKVRTRASARKERLQVAIYAVGVALLFVTYAYALVTHGLDVDLAEHLKRLTEDLT